MNKSSLVLVLVTSLLTGNSFAGSRITIIEPDAGWETTPPPGPIMLMPKWSWFVALDLLGGWENAGESQNALVAPNVENTFRAGRGTHIVGNVQLFGGVQRGISDTMQAQFGLAIGASGKASVKGLVENSADFDFENYNYSYHVQHLFLGGKAKLFADLGYWVTPWLSCSVGMARNKSSGFYSNAEAVDAEFEPSYAAHINSSLSYSIGTGVQKALDDHWQLGLGYEFSDWGRSSLSPGAGQIVNSTLKLTNFYTNGILLNITYVS